MRFIPWSPRFNPDSHKSTSAQVWVTFYNLPWEFWDKRIMASIARAIGVPLRFDKNTVEGEMGHYARILIDVELSKEIQYKLRVDTDTSMHWISLEYERLPDLCSICHSIGHSAGACRRNIRREEHVELKQKNGKQKMGSPEPRGRSVTRIWKQKRGVHTDTGESSKGAPTNGESDKPNNCDLQMVLHSSVRINEPVLDSDSGTPPASPTLDFPSYQLDNELGVLGWQTSHSNIQVMFPSTLLETGENWTLMKTISVTEYLNYEAGKFSKSKGIRVFGNDAKDTNIPVEVWRYYLLTNRPEVSDTLLPGPIYKQNSTVSCSVIWATLSIEFRALLLNLQAQDMVQLFQMLLLLTHIH
ncbi:uncharacterized protein [Euphorbia lathyris]|uniref:uncharacterized protein isoform X1 n=1 Tax=Euphorbia lathyris TaxID=212925 RepID=UPI0033133768